MTVDWTERAIADLDAIYNYIATDSEYFASLVVERLVNRCEQIAAFPRSGQIVPEYARDDIREVFEYTYRMMYLVGDDTTWVVAVCHAAKPLPASPPIG